MNPPMLRNPNPRPLAPWPDCFPLGGGRNIDTDGVSPGLVG